MSTLRERNFERLRKSISGEKCDAHACFNYYTYPFYQTHTGVELQEYFRKPQVMLAVQTEVLGKLENVGNLTPDVGSVAEASSLGGVVKFDEHGFISVHEAGIEDIDDLKDLKPGDPYGDNYMRIALEQLQYMTENKPEGLGINPANVMGPFTVAAQLRGIGDFCADTIAEPELVDALLEIVIETEINYLKAQEKILGKLKHVLICDDLAAFLSEPEYERLVLPTYDKLFEQFPNVQRWYHNDSTAAHIASAIPKGGFSAWQYGPCVDPQKALCDTQGKVTLIGGIKPTDLAKYSVEQTVEVCSRMIDEFNGNSRFVLSAGGSVNQTPLENILAMFRTADQKKI